MRIAVIGAGAMGSTFGGKLVRAGHDVIFVDTNTSQVAALRTNGMTVRDPSGEFNLPVRATAEISGLSEINLALVLVDSNATATIAPLLSVILARHGYVLTLQNGIGNIEALVAHLGAERVLAGSTFVSAAMIAPGHAHNTNVGDTVLGEVSGGHSPRAESVAALLRQAGLPTEVSGNVQGVIWSKFALNCALNPLSAITGLRPGEIVRHPEMSALLDTVIAEIMAVVAAKSIMLPESDPKAHILEHAWTRYNRPSMLQHMEAERPTEIGSLNAALVREADLLGVAVPANRALTALVRGLEAKALRGANVDEARLEALACTRQNPQSPLTTPETAA